MKRGTISDSEYFKLLTSRGVELAKKKDDQLSLATIYQNIGNHYSYLNKPNVAIQYFDSSSTVSLQVNDSSFLITNEIRKAFLLEQIDSYGVEDTFNKWLPIAKEHDLYSSVIEAYNGLGILYENRRDLTKAFEAYFNALKVADSQNDIRYQGIMLNNLGLMRLNQKQYDNAISDFENGLSFALQTDDDRLIFNLKNNLGLIFTEQKKFEEALEHYQASLNFAKVNNSFPVNLVVSYLNLASSYISLEAYDLADKYIDSGKYIVENHNLSVFYPKVFFLRGKLFKDKGDQDKAIHFFEKGLTEARKINFFDSNVFDGVMNTIYNLSKIYDERKEYEKAYRKINEYHQINDSIKGLLNDKKVSELESAYYREKIEANLLQEKNRRIQLEKENERKQAQFIVISISLLSILIFLLLFFHGRYQKAKKIEQQRYSQKILDQIDKERVRISRDLHDDLGQSLSLIKSKINRFQKGNEINFDELSTDVSSVINQTRLISHSLHPAHLEKIGLKKSIESLLDKVENSTHLITNFIIDDEVNKLHKDIQIQLYRVSQEAINNTVKHANAKSIRIKIQFDKAENKWIYSYRDNGKGINVSKEEAYQGIGLKTISERTKKIHGKLKILSSLEKGTTININFKG